MAFRAPLVPKNASTDNKSTNGKKDSRSLVPPTMDRAHLLESLKTINEKYAIPCCKVKLTDEDLTKPTGEKMYAIYMMLLNVVFDITPSTLHHIPFRETPHEFPELYDDFYYRRQFLDAMGMLMEACLPGGNDFHPRDITDPEPKRIQKHLSVCVNYIKFKDYINKAYKLQEDEQQLLELPEKIEEMEVKSQELEQEISILKLKKQEQKEIEDNLTKEIAQKKSDCTELESYIIKMEKRHKKSQSDKQEKMQELTEITEENNILQGRLDDLTSQVVTCPEQLHQQLKQITEYYEEAYRDKEETAQNVKLWESLDKNARDIPNYIETITNEVREFEEKVELSNELDKKFEDMLNTNAKMKQNLKENSSKNLNLDKQINLITEEKASLSYDMCRKGSSTNNELIKELEVLKCAEVEKNEKDKLMLLEIDQLEQENTINFKTYNELSNAVNRQIKALTEAFERHKKHVITIEDRIPQP